MKGKNKNNIKAVTLDLWNTLIEEKNYWEYRIETINNHLEKHGISRNWDEIQEGFRYATNLFEKEWKEKYLQMPLSTRITHIYDFLDVPIQQDSINQLITDFNQTFPRYPPAFKEGVTETVEALSSEYKLGIISDTGITHGRVIRNFFEGKGLLKNFSSTIFSDELGYCKPHPKPFETALSELGVMPHEAVHVGDLLRTDVAGAKNVGMKAIWVKSGNKPVIDGVKPDYTITFLPELLNVLNLI